MKKIIFFTTVCIMLASCSRIDNPNEAQNRNSISFKQGEKVTISVSAPGQSKVTSSVDGKSGDVSFNWEPGDQIMVMVGTESAVFTLKSGAGTSSARFEGTMPASGDEFNVQYPLSKPDLTSQTYSVNSLPEDKMMFTATGCTLGTDFELEPIYAALRLNLYGLNRDLNQIVVENTDLSESYTLTCSTAVRVGNSSSNATPFFIVLPATSASSNYTITVTSAPATQALDAIPEYSDLGYTEKGIIIPFSSYSTTQSLTAGEVIDMPAKPITVVWAPVNCGYEAADGDYKGYPFGKLYQWGRKYGQGYKGGSYEDDDYPQNTGAQKIVNITKPEELLTKHPDGADYNGNFYGVDFDPKNWYGGLNADKLWNTNEGTSNPVSKSDYDPCPDGWRVPTKVELEILMGSKTSFGPIEKGNHGTSEVDGIKFDGGNGESDNYVFLPIAGYNQSGGTSSNRGSSIYYWSSTVNNVGKSCMLVKGGKMGNKVLVGFDCRVFGCSVRCVKK